MLLDRINNAVHEGKFSKPPRGPIGKMFIQTAYNCIEVLIRCPVKTPLKSAKEANADDEKLLIYLTD